MWSEITIVILFIVVVAFAILTFVVENSNSKKQKSNIFFPFATTLNVLDPSKPKPLSKKITKTVSGQPIVTEVPQIQCPVGFKVNIVGAFSEVFDPYGQCSPFPADQLKVTCGLDSANVFCSTDKDCDPGQQCVGGKCQAMTCSTDSDCLKNGGTAYDASVSPNRPGLACVGNKCIMKPICSNINSVGQNAICNPTGAAACRPRDVSAWLAAECDGKQTCNISWNPASPKGFGPLPCRISTTDTEYTKLPLIPGWDGSSPTAAKKPKAEQSIPKQGYYVHGIYTCIPDDE